LHAEEPQLHAACPGLPERSRTLAARLRPGGSKGPWNCSPDVRRRANAVRIFQISGDLTQSSATQVSLTGGALAKNVFWQVAGTVDVGTTAHSAGIILSQTAIKLETGASLSGRALAQTAISPE
jgi:hypothetical protein